MARRGAKPHTGRSISLRKIDRGTPELRAKRCKLVGNSDDFRAGSLLGVLAARGEISDTEHEAGKQLAELYFEAVKPSIGFCQSVLVANGPISARANPEPPMLAGYTRARTLFNKARRAIVAEYGPTVVLAVENVALFGQLPASSTLDLRNGLAALAEYWRATKMAKTQ